MPPASSLPLSPRPPEVLRVALRHAPPAIAAGHAFRPCRIASRTERIKRCHVQQHHRQGRQQRHGHQRRCRARPRVSMASRRVREQVIYSLTGLAESALYEAERLVHQVKTTVSKRILDHDGSKGTEPVDTATDRQGRHGIPGLHRRRSRIPVPADAPTSATRQDERRRSDERHAGPGGLAFPQPGPPPDPVPRNFRKRGTWHVPR